VSGPVNQWVAPTDRGLGAAGRAPLPLSEPMRFHV